MPPAVAQRLFVAHHGLLHLSIEHAGADLNEPSVARAHAAAALPQLEETAHVRTCVAKHFSKDHGRSVVFGLEVVSAHRHEERCDTAANSLSRRHHALGSMRVSEPSMPSNFCETMHPQLLRVERIGKYSATNRGHAAGWAGIAFSPARGLHNSRTVGVLEYTVGRIIAATAPAARRIRSHLESSAGRRGSFRLLAVVLKTECGSR